MSEATVTAVSVAYRSRHTLPDTLAEARRAHDAGILECIVVDNASGDGTLDYLAESEPWVERIASPANLGFGRGCNLAFSRVGTRYVLLLNPDAVLPLEDLRRLIAFLDSHPEAGMVAPAIRYPDGSLQHAGGLPTPGSLVCTALGRPPAPRRIIQPGERAFATDWLCGAVLLARKSVLDELGGFDPRFFLYFEETDLCRRAQGHGHRLFALGEAVASHLHAASARTTGAALYSGCIADHYFPSRFYYLTKHFGVLRAVAAELGELGILLARIGSARLRGRSAPELAVRLRSPLLRRPPMLDGS